MKVLGAVGDGHHPDSEDEGDAEQVLNDTATDLLLFLTCLLTFSLFSSLSMIWSPLVLEPWDSWRLVSVSAWISY